MCQLLGMNCNTPTDIQFSFEGFAKRGGLTDHHADGWGIAFFEGLAARVFIDHRPAIDSPVAELIRAYPIRSLNVISHIRKATQGVVNLQNCHPFTREMWGQAWVFAHNGNLEKFSPALSGHFLPIGDTDSEHAFCAILDHLKHTFGVKPETPPTPVEIAAAIEPLLRTFAQHGTFNMLLSNGQALWAFCTTQLHYIVRRHPFQAAHLVDCDVSVDFSTVTQPNDKVAVIATIPLTDNEVWTPFEPQRLMCFVDGEPMI